MTWLEGAIKHASHNGMTSLMLPDEMHDRMAKHLYGRTDVGIEVDACKGTLQILKGGWTEKVCALYAEWDDARRNKAPDAGDKRAELIAAAPWLDSVVVVPDAAGVDAARARMTGRVGERVFLFPCDDSPPLMH
jgi:hypothetical protein